MSIGRFEIQFDQPSVYVSGQHVTGNVIIELLKEKRFRAIELKFLGEAKVHWTESSGDDEDSYDNHEIYINNTVHLVGDPSTEVTLPPGIYTYPFTLILPLNIPSSFESSYGHVRYTIRAAICRPWRFDHKCKVAFTVINPLDLNSEPALLEPVQTTTEKRLCCGCGGSPITVVVSLPFAGYVPGQSCRGFFELDNASGSDISVRVYLVQVVNLIASCGRKKTDHNVVCKDDVGFVNRRQSMTASVCLRIPPVPNSYLRHCNCIDVSYILEIRGTICGMHRDLHGQVTIVIGSIPLRAQFEHITQWNPQDLPAQTSDKYPVGLPAVGPDAQGTSSTTCESSHPFLRYPEMPPPTYEECISGKISIQNEEDDKYVRGSKDFAPQYPVYSFKESNS